MNILVAVWMITYNHEKFIAQAIESIIAQKTSFSFKLFIGEDCSTDNTKQKIQELIEKYPDKIHARFNENNLGVKPNLVTTFKECFSSGAKYIAMCEGDDYWIDEYKLQKQVDFLENNTDHVLVTTNAFKVKEGNDFKKAELFLYNVESYSFGMERLIQLPTPTVTLTVCFRNNLVKEYPDIFWESTGGDLRYFMLLAEHGKCYYLNNVTGVYRKHQGGVTHIRKGRKQFLDRLNRYEESLQNNINWNEYFEYRYDKEFTKNIIDRHKKIIKFSIAAFKFGKAIKHYKQLKQIQNK